MVYTKILIILMAHSFVHVITPRIKLLKMMQRNLILWISISEIEMLIRINSSSTKKNEKDKLLG